MFELSLMIAAIVAYFIAAYYAWDLGVVRENGEEEDITLLKTLFLPAVLLIGWVCALMCKVFGWSEDDMEDK